VEIIRRCKGKGENKMIQLVGIKRILKIEKKKKKGIRNE
jgi:hypothetical protein